MNSGEEFTRVGDYILKQILGTGNFSKVRLAVHQRTGKEYACKILDKEFVKQRAGASQVQREVSVMRTLQHPNTVQLIAVLASKYKVFIIMELVTGGELFSEIERHGRLTEPYARFYFRQLVDGMQYCHNHGVYHRDLKPENLLLCKNGQLKITDFGLSFLKENADADKSVTKSFALHTQCGTPNYVAPEIITVTANGYSGGASDAWSCGIILYVLCAGRLPFDSDETETLFKCILQGHVHFPSHFSPELKDLISNLLKTKPRQRYRLANVRRHPWFTSKEVETTMPRGLVLPVENFTNSDTERSSEKDADSYQNSSALHSETQQQPVERSDYASTETESLGSRRHIPHSPPKEQNSSPDADNMAFEDELPHKAESVTSTDTFDNSIKAKRVDEVPLMSEAELTPNGSAVPEQGFAHDEPSFYEGSTRTASEADAGYYTSGATTISGNDSDFDHEREEEDEDEDDGDLAGESSVDFQNSPKSAIQNYAPAAMPSLVNEQRSEYPSPEAQPDYSQGIPPQMFPAVGLPPYGVVPGVMDPRLYSIQQQMSIDPSLRQYGADPAANVSTYVPLYASAPDSRLAISSNYDLNPSLQPSGASRSGRRSLLADSPIQHDDLSFAEGQGMTPLSGNLVPSGPQSKSVHFSPQEQSIHVKRFIERNGVYNDLTVSSSDDEMFYRGAKPVIPGESSHSWDSRAPINAAPNCKRLKPSRSLNDITDQNHALNCTYSSDGSSKPGTATQTSYSAVVRRQFWDHDQSWRSKQFHFFDGESETDGTTCNSATFRKMVNDVRRLYAGKSESENESPIATPNTRTSFKKMVSNDATQYPPSGTAHGSRNVEKTSSMRIVRSNSHDGKIAECAQNRNPRSTWKTTTNVDSDHFPTHRRDEFRKSNGHDSINRDSANTEEKSTAGSLKRDKTAANPKQTRKVLRFADTDLILDGTSQSNKKWVKIASDAVVWSEMMKDFDMIPNDVEFGMTTERLSHLWQEGLEKESIMKEGSFSDYFLKSNNTYIQSRSTRKLLGHHVNRSNRSAGGFETMRRKKSSSPQKVERKSRQTVNHGNAQSFGSPSSNIEDLRGRNSPTFSLSSKRSSADEGLGNSINGGSVPKQQYSSANSVCVVDRKDQITGEDQSPSSKSFQDESSSLPNAALMSHLVLSPGSRTHAQQPFTERKKSDSVGSTNKRENWSAANGYKEGQHDESHVPRSGHELYKDTAFETQEAVGSTVANNQNEYASQSVPIDEEESAAEENVKVSQSSKRMDKMNVGLLPNRGNEHGTRQIFPEDEISHDQTSIEVSSLPTRTPERSEDPLSSSPTTPGLDHAPNLRNDTDSPHLGIRRKTSDRRHSTAGNSAEEDGVGSSSNIISRNVSGNEDRPNSLALRKIILETGAVVSDGENPRSTEDEHLTQIAEIMQRFNQAQAQGHANPINPFQLDIPSPRGKPPPSRTLLTRIPTVRAFVRKHLQKRFDYRRGLNFQSFLTPVESLDIVRDVLKANDCFTSVSLQKSNRQKIKFVWNGSEGKRRARVHIFSTGEAGGSTVQFRREREFSVTDDEEFISFYKKIRKDYSKKAIGTYALRSEKNNDDENWHHRQMDTKDNDEEGWVGRDESGDQLESITVQHGLAESSNEIDADMSNRAALESHLQESRESVDTPIVDSHMEPPS